MPSGRRVPTPETDFSGLPSGQITLARSKGTTFGRSRNTLARITVSRCSTCAAEYGGACPGTGLIDVHGGIIHTTRAPVADNVSITFSYSLTRYASNAGWPIDEYFDAPG